MLKSVCVRVTYALVCATESLTVFRENEIYVRPVRNVSCSHYVRIEILSLRQPDVGPERNT